MLEITGTFAIIAVFVGSVLLALFVGEALITSTIRLMSLGVQRADQARSGAAIKPRPARIVAGL
jgi:hypothetical protein